MNKTIYFLFNKVNLKKKKNLLFLLNRLNKVFPLLNINIYICEVSRNPSYIHIDVREYFFDVLIFLEISIYMWVGICISANCGSIDKCWKWCLSFPQAKSPELHFWPYRLVQWSEKFITLSDEIVPSHQVRYSNNVFFSFFPYFLHFWFNESRILVCISLHFASCCFCNWNFGCF